MLYYRGRLLDIDNDLLSTHAEINGGSPEEWRYDCYVCSEYRINEADIDVYISDLSDSELTELFRKRLSFEIELYDALVNDKVSNCIFPIGETKPFNAKILRIS